LKSSSRSRPLASSSSIRDLMWWVEFQRYLMHWNWNSSLWQATWDYQIERNEIINSERECCATRWDCDSLGVMCAPLIHFFTFQKRTRPKDIGCCDCHLPLVWRSVGWWNLDSPPCDLAFCSQHKKPGDLESVCPLACSRKT
jgi:hypothetical protein